MNTERLRKRLEQDEGKRLDVYIDSLGKPTVGIGHLILAIDHLELGDTITEERCEELFEMDLNLAINACKILYKYFDTLPEAVQEILVNLMFNLGTRVLRQFFKFNKAIEEGTWKRAAIEGRDSLWFRQVKGRAIRLMLELENIV